jgi:hypothetical protein
MYVITGKGLSKLSDPVALGREFGERERQL